MRGRVLSCSNDSAGPDVLTGSLILVLHSIYQPITGNPEFDKSPVLKYLPEWIMDSIGVKDNRLHLKYTWKADRAWEAWVRKNVNPTPSGSYPRKLELNKTHIISLLETFGPLEVLVATFLKIASNKTIPVSIGVIQDPTLTDIANSIGRSAGGIKHLREFTLRNRQYVKYPVHHVDNSYVARLVLFNLLHCNPIDKVVYARFYTNPALAVIFFEKEIYIIRLDLIKQEDPQNSLPVFYAMDLLLRMRIHKLWVNEDEGDGVQYTPEMIRSVYFSTEKQEVVSESPLDDIHELSDLFDKAMNSSHPIS
eukprot:Gregarina_sp_Poly_1__1190@NODE_1291_length_4476_cov_38_535722_g872_i0_p2_GENE_NODE_1291_length_4476_cov_38_535722_g872_i0NODE_1291_length_4476_cov_38_535722_g872_i0_p2_ORF_typecomplete_len308_score31_64_NODE_1291_length_4476_cov_38_535722_g872_i01461069